MKISIADKLLEKAQKAKKNHPKKNLNVDSELGVLTAEEISMVLALRAKKMRIAQGLKQKEMSMHIGAKTNSSYAHFEQTGIIRLSTFIKVLRTLGRLSDLEALLKATTKDKIDQLSVKQRERVK
jgi:hypothetical protein